MKNQPELFGVLLAAISCWVLSSCTTQSDTKDSIAMAAVYQTQQAWKPSGLPGIAYRWGGGDSKILYLKNTTGQWQRIECNDGTGWRYDLLNPGESSMALARKTHSLQFRFEA